MAKRVRIVLMVADGMPNGEIGVLVDLHYNQVGIWHQRYSDFGFLGLEDEERSRGPVAYGMTMSCCS